MFKRNFLFATGTTWLLRDAVIRYLFDFVEGGAELGCLPLHSDGAASWSYATDQQLFVTPLDAQASTVRTLNEGETI